MNWIACSDCDIEFEEERDGCPKCGGHNLSESEKESDLSESLESREIDRGITDACNRRIT